MGEDSWDSDKNLLARQLFSSVYNATYVTCLVEKVSGKRLTGHAIVNQSKLGKTFHPSAYRNTLVFLPFHPTTTRVSNIIFSDSVLIPPLLVDW